MKAKDYVNLFNEKGRTEVGLVEICFLFFQEAKILRDKRQVKTDLGFISIVKELDDKYRAFSRLASTSTEYIRPEGFRLYMEVATPELWTLLKGNLK